MGSRVVCKLVDEGDPSQTLPTSPSCAHREPEWECMSPFPSGKQVFPLGKVGPEEHGSAQMTAWLSSVLEPWETASLQRSLVLEHCQFSGFIPTPLLSLLAF